MSIKQKDSDLIVIYTGNPIDSEMIKNFLTDQGIAANLRNQLMGTIAPWQISASGFEPVEIEIFARDKEKALRLIKEFNKNK